MDSQEHKMTANEWKLFNHQKKLDKVWEKNRYYCHCGHSVAILPKEERTFCTYCGHWVYKNKRKQKQNIKRIEKEYQERLEKKKRDTFINEMRERLHVL